MARHRSKTACSFWASAFLWENMWVLSWVTEKIVERRIKDTNPKNHPGSEKRGCCGLPQRKTFFFPPFSPCVFVHFKPDRAFSQPASELPLLIGRCRFVPLSSTSFSLGSSCDLLCLYSTILTLSFSPNPTNNEGDTCWSHLAPGLCESITEGGRRTPVYSCPVAPPPQHDILSSVTQLARSSGSHPKTGIMHVRVGASHASCQPFVGGSVCLEWLPLGACGSTIAGILSATPIYAQHVNRSKDVSGCTGFVSRLPRSTCISNSVTLWEIESSLFFNFFCSVALSKCF